MSRCSRRRNSRTLTGASAGIPDLRHETWGSQRQVDYRTVTVTLFLVLPDCLVALSVYVVVAGGVTIMLLPCTPPSLSINEYESLLMFQLSVTGVPFDTVFADAVKLRMTGIAPLGAVPESQPGHAGVVRDPLRLSVSLLYQSGFWGF